MDWGGGMVIPHDFKDGLSQYIIINMCLSITLQFALRWA